MKRVLNDALVSAAALVLLLGTLASFDARVRDHVVRSIQSASVESAGLRLADMSSVVMQAARDRSVEHAALTLFVLAAAVLVVFMLRT